MKSTNAQISQMFVWIMVILLIGAIALIGTKSISGVLDNKCTVDQITFEKNLENTIHLNNDYGAINLEKLSLPCDYTTICFADARLLDKKIAPSLNNIDDASLGGLFKAIQQSVEDGVSNVFLFTGKSFKELPAIEQIRLDKGTELTDNTNEILCFNRNAGKITMKLEGLGKYTLVSPST